MSSAAGDVSQSVVKVHMGRISTVRVRGSAHVMAAALGIALVVLCAVLAWGHTTFAAQPPETAQDEFVPMDDIPPEDQLPAAPLLVTAYSAVWAIAIGYLWTIWRRLGAVEREFADVSRRLSERDQECTEPEVHHG